MTYVAGAVVALGLIALNVAVLVQARRALAALRGDDVTLDEVFQMLEKHHVIPEDRSYLETLSAVYQGADRQHKALLDFTLADLDHLGALCAGQRKGWAAREGVVKGTRAALKASSKERVRDLPEATLRSLAEQWEEVWRA